MKPDNDLEDQVIHFPHWERARIALRLIESLDPNKDEDVSSLWLDEAEQRLADFDAGKTDARDADKVFSEVERQLI